MNGELAGRLRTRVAISRRQPARDALGGSEGSWTTIGESWAGIAPGEAGSIVAGDARGAAPRWRVTLRTGADVAVGDRLLWRGRRLRVRSRTDDPATPDRFVAETEEER